MVLVKQFVVLEYGTACRPEPQVRNLQRSETAGLYTPSFFRITAVLVAGQRKPQMTGVSVERLLSATLIGKLGADAFVRKWRRYAQMELQKDCPSLSRCYASSMLIHLNNFKTLAYQ
jgi:hypothetical protein